MPTPQYFCAEGEAGRAAVRVSGRMVGRMAEMELHLGVLPFTEEFWECFDICPI